MLANGAEFDSGTFTFRVGRGEVIRAWDDAVLSMSVGQRARICAAPEEAYGTRGFPPVIPPNATLYFLLDLLSVA